MFKKIHTSDKFIITTIGSNTTLSYTPSFNTKDIKITKAVLEIKKDDISSTMTEFSILTNNYLIDKVKINKEQEKIYIDITDELQDYLYSNANTLEFLLENLVLSTKDNLKCTIKYLPLKFWNDNNKYLSKELDSKTNFKINVANRDYLISHKNLSFGKLLPSTLLHSYTSHNALLNNDTICENSDYKILPNYFCGKGWKLNFQQYLIKEKVSDNIDNVSENYTYIDGQGNHIKFQIKYYYENNNKKNYILSDKVNIDVNKKLYYTIDDINYEVKLETNTNSDYFIFSKYENINNLHLVDQDIEEISNLKQQINHYEKTSKSYNKNLEYYQKKLILSLISLHILNKQKDIQELNTQYKNIQDELEQTLLSANAALLKIQIHNSQADTKSVVAAVMEPNPTGNVAYPMKTIVKKDSIDEIIERLEYFASEPQDDDQAKLNAYVSDVTFDTKWGLNRKGTIDGLVFLNNSIKAIETELLKEITKDEAANFIKTKFESIIDSLGDETLNKITGIIFSERNEDTQDNLNLFTNNNNKISFSEVNINEMTVEIKNLVSEIENIISEKENLENELDKYNKQLLNYEKDVPEIYITDKNKQQFLGFAKSLKSINEKDDIIYRLVSIGDNYDNAIFINYENIYQDAKITSIANTENDELNFNYDNNLLISISDNNGKTHKFNYDETKSYLTQILNFDSETTTFSYDDNGYLINLENNFGYGLNIKKENNIITLNEISTYAKITNDNLIKNTDNNLEEAKEEKLLATINLYNYKSTIVTDNLGNTITYLFDNYGRPITEYQGINFEDSSSFASKNSITHNFSNNKITRNIKKLQMSKNLLNVYSENYLGDDVFLGDDVYATLYEKPKDNTIYEFTNTLNTENKKEIVVSGDIVELLNYTTRSFVFSGFAKSDSAYINTYENEEANELDNLLLTTLDPNRKFELSAVLTYSDGETETLKNSFDWMQTNWQYCELPIILKENKTLTSLKLYFDYSYNTNSVKFTALSLNEAIVEETIYEDKKVKTITNSLHKTKMLYEYENDLPTLVTLQYKGKDYKTNYYYNSFGAVTKIIDHTSGNIKEYQYNDKGQKIKELEYNIKDASSKFVKSINLDEKGFETTSTNEFGENLEEFEYEGNKLISSKDSDGKKTIFAYDPLNDNTLGISKVSNDEDNNNSYSYNLGLNTKVSHNNFDIDFEYDGFGRQTGVKINHDTYLNTHYLSEFKTRNDFVSGEIVETKKDNSGNVTNINYYIDEFDYETNNLSPTLNYVKNSYDEFNNLIKQEENIYDKSFENTNSYDKFGNLVKYTRKNITNDTQELEILNEYDSLNNVTKTNLNIGSNIVDYAFSYSEYPENNLKKIDITQSSHLTTKNITENIEYDALNRLKEIKINDKLSKTLAYKKVGEHTSNLVNSIWFGENGIIKNNLKYSYDIKGNITKICYCGKEIVRYSYDELSRLIREDNKELDKTFVFSYDIGGNILNKTCYKYSLKPIEFLEQESENTYYYPVSGWKDQLANFNNESFVYDSLGNPTTYRGKTLKWGHLRNLEKYNIVNDIAQVAYTYNSNGIRTSKTTSTSTTKYVLSGNKILSQNTNGTNIYFQYGIDGLIGFNYDNVKQYYYKKNAQGDIIGIYDDSYTEIVKYVYDAWGNHQCRILTSFGTFEQIDLTKEYTTTEQNYILIANTNPFRYRSYYYDTETGLYYLNSRYYDPELGRFINADDINLINPYINNGINLYSYCYNNPNYFIDNSGMIPENYKLTSHFTKFHQIWQLIKDSTIGAIIGNLSITTSIIETGDPSLLYSYSSFGYDTIQEGVGININKQIGIEGYYTIGNSWTDISVGFNSQAGPFSIGVSIGGSGIGFGFGLTFKNTAVDLSINIGWGTIALAGATFLSIAAIPVPGMRVIATIASFFILIFG